MRSIPKTSASLALAVALVACSGQNRVAPPRWFGAGATTPHRGGTLRISIVDDVRNLDPAIGFDEFSNYAEHLLYDTLLDYQPATEKNPLELVPELAESWSLSPDGLVYSFTLRDATFSDGEPVVAGDFVYALSRVLDPTVPSPGAAFYGGIVGGRLRRKAGKDGRLARLTHTGDGVPGLVAVDDRHLEIHLEKPDASFPLLLAMPFATPQKKAWVAKQGKRMRDTPLGTGPFTLGEWKEGQSMRFDRNARYWDPELPYLDHIEMLLLVDRAVSVLKFLNGEIDAVERLSSDEYLRFAQSPEWAPYIFKTLQMAVYGEGMDETRPPFSDKRVRLAMNYALNKDDTVTLYNQRALVAHGVYPPLLPGYDPNLPPYPHDPAKARALLAEAGYPHGFSVTYDTTRDEMSEKIAQSIQSDLAEVGVKVNIELLTFPAYLTAVGKHDLQFFYSAWNMDFPDPWDFIEVKFHSKNITPENSNNDTAYSNPALDAILDKARVEVDPGARLHLYQQAEDILHDDCPWIWHYYIIQPEILHPYVKNYVPHPVWIRDYRRAWLDLPKVRR